MNQNEVTRDKTALVKISQTVTDGACVGHADEVDRREGAEIAFRAPSVGVVDVGFDVFGVGTAVDEDFLDAVGG